MPTVQSKEGPGPEPAAYSRAVQIHVFLAVCQQVIMLQSEPLLVRELCKGDVAATAQLLSNSLGFVGVMGLLVNQVGGKLSDSRGRKPYLLLGPLGNILWGLLVYSKPADKGVVISCRVLRHVLTTFSNTVMISATIADMFSGTEQAVISSKVGAVVGAAVVVTPLFEALILQRTGHPKYVYPALSLLAAVNLLYDAAFFPETMVTVNQVNTPITSLLAAANPFGFLNIFSRGSKLLQRLTVIITLQMFLEGKNLSDITEIWKRNHLNWGIDGSRNFVVLNGMLCVMAGASLTPKLLTNPAHHFTSFTNFTNALGFFLRGAFSRSWIFILAAVFMLPGVNGTSAAALRPISTSLAMKEGFGRGEFSAWMNNLRALAGSAAPMIFGNYYAWCARSGIHSGSVYMVAGLLGAVLPEAILRLINPDDLAAADCAGASAKPCRAASLSTALARPAQAKAAPSTSLRKHEASAFQPESQPVGSVK